MKNQKMHATDLCRAGLFYIHSERVTDPAGNTGTRFVIDTKLTAAQRDFIRSFNNTILSGAYYRHAPDITYPVVIIMDQPLTA